MKIKNIHDFLKLKVRKDKFSEIPSGIRHAVPNIILMFIIFNVLILGISIFKKYRRSSLDRRFSLTKLGEKILLFFFIIENVVVSMISITFLYIIAFLFFKFRLSVWIVLGTYLIYLIFSFTISSLSVLLALNFKREEGAEGVSILVANLLCALGGLWWPLEIVPSFFKKIGLILPSGIAMKILDKIVYFKVSPGDMFLEIFFLFIYFILFFHSPTLLLEKSICVSFLNYTKIKTFKSKF